MMSELDELRATTVSLLDHILSTRNGNLCCSVHCHPYHVTHLSVPIGGGSCTWDSKHCQCASWKISRQLLRRSLSQNGVATAALYFREYEDLLHDPASQKRCDCRLLISAVWELVYVNLDLLWNSVSLLQSDLSFHSDVSLPSEDTSQAVFEWISILLSNKTFSFLPLQQGLSPAPGLSNSKKRTGRSVGHDVSCFLSYCSSDKMAEESPMGACDVCVPEVNFCVVHVGSSAAVPPALGQRTCQILSCQKAARVSGVDCNFPQFTSFPHRESLPRLFCLVPASDDSVRNLPAWFLELQKGSGSYYVSGPSDRHEGQTASEQGPESLKVAVSQPVNHLPAFALPPMSKLFPCQEAPYIELAMHIFHPHVDPAVYQLHQVSLFSRVLLYGPTGGGKSWVLRQLATVYNRKVVFVQVTGLFGSYVGQTEENLRRVFKTASDSVVVLEGIDRIGRATDNGLTHGHNKPRDPGSVEDVVRRRVLTTLLLCLDSIDCHNAGAVVATSQLPPTHLEDSLVRAGRLETWIRMPGMSGDMCSSAPGGPSADL
eukprot:GHVQ01018459.1.p1 GENE.GHVQ01018459.1~~GHVQ01018459.1.p1  ORF type:complete len:543 (+),score=50.85 GHVQ01018459.1:349-1977(+)